VASVATMLFKAINGTPWAVQAGVCRALSGGVETIALHHLRTAKLRAAEKEESYQHLESELANQPTPSRGRFSGAAGANINGMRFIQRNNINMARGRKYQREYK